MRPHSVVNVTDAVHVEGVEADLFRHRAVSSAWRVQRFCECGGVRTGGDTEVGARPQPTRATLFLSAW
jgi:hypothetical protein